MSLRRTILIGIGAGGYFDVPLFIIDMPFYAPRLDDEVVKYVTTQFGRFHHLAGELSGVKNSSPENSSRCPAFHGSLQPVAGDPANGENKPSPINSFRYLHPPGADCPPCAATQKCVRLLPGLCAADELAQR